MMRGRMVHDRDGNSGLQRYGVDDSEVIWSVSRGALNMLLLDAAEAAGVRFHFGQSLVGAAFDRRRIRPVAETGRSAERRLGTECVCTCCSRCSPYLTKKHITFFQLLF